MGEKKITRVPGLRLPRIQPPLVDLSVGSKPSAPIVPPPPPVGVHSANVSPPVLQRGPDAHTTVMPVLVANPSDLRANMTLVAEDPEDELPPDPETLSGEVVQPITEDVPRPSLRDAICVIRGETDGMPLGRRRPLADSTMIVLSNSRSKASVEPPPSPPEAIDQWVEGGDQTPLEGAPVQSSTLAVPKPSIPNVRSEVPLCYRFRIRRRPPPESWFKRHWESVCLAMIIFAFLTLFIFLMLYAPVAR